MHVIMPVVGEGRRFREAGYKELKPFIHIRGKPMIEWSLDPIPRDWTVWVICKKQDEMNFQANLSGHGRKLELIAVPGPSQGAACTVLAVAPFLPPGEPVMVVNCDQWFFFNQYKRTLFNHGLAEFQNYVMAKQWDGYILTFTGHGDRWSYVKEDNEGLIMSVAEKNPISNQATVGVYWFREAHALFKGVSIMVAENIRTKGEFYLAPIYNELKWRLRHKIRAVPVGSFWGLGTPEEIGRACAAVFRMTPPTKT